MNWKRFRFVLLLAKRDILDDRKISLIVIAMLSFSFLNLVFFPAFIQGLSDTFNSNIVETQTGHVLIQADGGRLDNPDSLKRKISGLEGVEEVEKRFQFSANVNYKSRTITATVIGTSTPGSEVYTSRVVSGNPLRQGQTDKALIGDSLAGDENSLGSEGLNVKPGRIVTMRTGEGTRDLKAEGRIGRPGPGTLVRQIIIPYETAEELNNAEGEATSIKVLLEDREDAADFKQKLQSLNVAGDIKTWNEVSDVANSIDSTFSIVTGVVSLVGLIVAITSIGVVIFINTNKRARETGIIRSIGAERLEVLQIFVLEALIFGAIGVLVGNIIMISIHAYLLSNPLSTPLGSLSTILTTELLVTRSAWMLAASLVAGLIPAYLVSQREIVDTIEQR